MVALQNPQSTSPGALQLIDVKFDTTQNLKGTVKAYFIHGYAGNDPITIQDFPGTTSAYVYSALDGKFTPVNTSTDSATGAINPGALSTSIYTSPDRKYIYAGQPEFNGGYMVVDRLTDGYLTLIPLANISKLALSPGGTTLLIFQLNSNAVYQLIGINQDSINDTVAPVNGTFDRPVNAVYSVDGSVAYVLNCGPECGGTTASVTVLNATTLAQTANIPVPGGATWALQAGTTLYVAGQQLLSDGKWAGMLTMINTTTNTIMSTMEIGDGYHFRMSLGDMNTLWIGAKTCVDGELAATGQPDGCITYVNLTTNTVVVEPAAGDTGGIAPIFSTTNYQSYGKTYVAEGGTIHIFYTVDGSENIPSEVNVQVQGYANDIAFIDGNTNTQP
jgi:hypothetical protein